jgi:hypothetical protein
MSIRKGTAVPPLLGSRRSQRQQLLPHCWWQCPLQQRQKSARPQRQPPPSAQLAHLRQTLPSLLRQRLLLRSWQRCSASWLGLEHQHAPA